MEKPIIHSKKPISVELTKDQEYYWCSCGKSNGQPFCDGSHQGSSFSPMKFLASQSENAYLCQCKQTSNPPFCDGTHRTLKDVAKEEIAQVYDTKPISVPLKKGKEYYWCSCGRSQGQPFCDGSHQDTSFYPLGFTPKEDEEQAYLCQCKKTANPPYCDGAHNNIHGKEDAPKGKNTKEEPTVEYIHNLSNENLEETQGHGPTEAMGVPYYNLPLWDDIQIVVSQLAHKPLMDEDYVNPQIVIGPMARKPLKLDRPILVSDMSFGALSREAKISLAKGAEMAGTGICSGEGGMLDAEQENNSRYFFELGSAEFGFDWEKIEKVQAFHFKGGQAAKTGIGGHLPGKKVTEEIAKTRNLPQGKDAISPSTFRNLNTPLDFKVFAEKVREITGGIPIGFKISANHIEEDIQFAIDASADYIIIDGRGGGTGASPTLFRNNISIPLMPAIARARKYLDEQGRKEITLIATGGLRTPDQFIKAMALGADCVAIANAAIQSIGCVGARICNTNLCPAGIATQDPELRKRIDIEASAKKLNNFLRSSTHLMKMMARACSHKNLSDFNPNDLTSFKKEISDLTGISYAGLKK